MFMNEMHDPVKIDRSIIDLLNTDVYFFTVKINESTFVVNMTEDFPSIPISWNIRWIMNKEELNSTVIYHKVLNGTVNSIIM